MVSICPHNRTNPVNVDDPCYYCEGKWKPLLLSEAEREDLARYMVDGQFIVRCSRCGIVSMAIRAAAVRSQPVHSSS